MVFSSILFLLYFLPAFLLIYIVLGKKYKNLFILLASIVFYAWGAPRFIFVILSTTLCDFFLVRLMHQAAEERTRKIFLFLSVSINLALLFYFKYLNFFIDNLNNFLSLTGATP